MDESAAGGCYLHLVADGEAKTEPPRPSPRVGPSARADQETNASWRQEPQRLEVTELTVITEKDVENALTGAYELGALVAQMTAKLEAATDLRVVAIYAEALDELRIKLYKAQSLLEWGQTQLTKDYVAA